MTDEEMADNYPQLINRAEQFLKEVSEEKELKDKLIDEAQANWAKVDIYRRVCGSEFSYYDGFIACGILKEKRIAELEMSVGTFRTLSNEQATCIERLAKENTELKAQIEKMKSQYDYVFNQLCKSREILCSMISQYEDRKEIGYSTRECGKELLKEGLYKND